MFVTYREARLAIGKALSAMESQQALPLQDLGFKVSL